MEYRERHEVIYENGRVSRSKTTYMDAEGQVIGDLVSEYMNRPQFCNYEFRDKRARYEDGVRVEDDQLVLFRKKPPKNEVETATLPLSENQIVGQGFHRFIILNLENIAEGEIFHVRFAIPSRLSQYSFRIRSRKIEGDKVYIRLEIDNWFLRLFTPYMDTEYDLTSRDLLRYEGIPNLADASGRHKKVTITYSY